MVSVLSPPVFLDWTEANFLTSNTVCSYHIPASKGLLHGYEDEDHAGTPVEIVNNNIYRECDKVLDGVWIFGHHYTIDLGRFVWIRTIYTTSSRTWRKTRLLKMARYRTRTWRWCGCSLEWGRWIVNEYVQQKRIWRPGENIQKHECKYCYTI